MNDIFELIDYQIINIQADTICYAQAWHGVAGWRRTDKSQ